MKDEWTALVSNPKNNPGRTRYVCMYVCIVRHYVLRKVNSFLDIAPSSHYPYRRPRRLRKMGCLQVHKKGVVTCTNIYHFYPLTKSLFCRRLSQASFLGPLAVARCRLLQYSGATVIEFTGNCAAEDSRCFKRLSDDSRSQRAEVLTMYVGNMLVEKAKGILPWSLSFLNN